MMRRLIFFLFFISIFFATTVSDNNNRVTLYREDSAGNDQIEQDLDFSHSLGLSSSGRILSSSDGVYTDGVEDGDTICPGTVTASSTYTGDWAATFFEAVVLYDLPASCPRPSESTVPSNEDIRWDDADYDIFINEDPCIPGEACWGREEPTSDIRINEYFKSDSQRYLNRLGHVAVICTASDRLRKTGPGADFDSTRTTTSNAGFSQSLSLSSTGDYRIRDKFTVNGCMVVVRYPDCDSGERSRIFSRTTSAENGPQYSNALTEHDIDVTVANRQSSLQVLYTIPASGSTVEIPPGGSQIIIIQVRNNGDVTNRVNSVSVNNGFTATPTSCPTGSPGDGINENMAVNAEERVCFILTAPSYTGTTSTRVTLTYEALARTCSATTTDIRNYNVTFTVEEGSTGPYCTIDPSSISLQQNDTFTFGLDCFDEDDNPILCENVGWSVTGITADRINPTNDAVTLFINSSSGTGNLTASVGGLFSCDATIDVNNTDIDPCPTPPCPPPGDNGCELSPSTTYTHPEEISSFNIICPNNPAGQCNSVVWSISPTFGSVESSDDSFSLVRSGANVGSGILEATTDSGINFCSANITVSYAICSDFI
ncbi:hypothetical protein J4450_05320 [Candidatus Micrarchaeota archaeon]|nr:hypothetical protein [Candidatus Micrarchaeota archaeon]